MKGRPPPHPHPSAGLLDGPPPAGSETVRIVIHGRTNYTANATGDHAYRWPDVTIEDVTAWKLEGPFIVAQCVGGAVVIHLLERMEWLEVTKSAVYRVAD